MPRLLALLLAAAPPLLAGPFDKGGLSGVGARAFSLGGAVVAQDGQDASALWWNPAGLYAQPHHEVYYQYGSLLNGRSLDHLAAYRGEIPELGLNAALGYRSLGSTGAFRFTENTTMLGLSLPFDEKKTLVFGAGLKLYSTHLDVPGGEASGYGLDFGFLYRNPGPLKPLSLGLVVQDFQSDLRWATGIRLNPPQLLQLGAAWRFDDFTIAEFDSEITTDHIQATRSTQGFRLGVERSFRLKSWDMDHALALRLGYFQSSALAPTSLSGVFTLGAGFELEGAALDYAYIQDVSSLGETHRMSFKWNFDPFAEGGEPKPTPQATPTPTPALTEAPTPTPLPGPAATLELKADNDIFSPGARSRRPAALFRSSYDGKVRTYTLVITRRGGTQALRTLKGRKLPASLRWDGMDQKGRIVPDGAYVATLRLVDPERGLASAEARVEVDTRRPELKLGAYPRIFVPGDAERPVRFEPKVEKLSGIPGRWEIAIQTLEGKRVRLLEGRGLPPESLSWPGADDTGAQVPKETLFYAQLLLEMESGATASSPRQSLGSEVSAFEGEGALKVTLATVRFAPSDEIINLEDYKSLKEAAEAVKKSGAKYMLQVLGHADNAEAAQGPTGALELSYLRAKAVKDYLVESGGLEAEKVKAMGFGDERPWGDNASDSGRAKNRRVDLILYTQ